MSDPFLSSPISGLGMKTQQPSSSQREAETSWALVSGSYGETADQLVLCAFWVMVGFKGAFTPEQPVQDGSREPDEGLGLGVQSR